MKDYYSILGVQPSARESEIRKAFRKLAVRYHPDKNPSAEAKSLFQEINEAYDILSDPGKRAMYDSRRENPLAEILSEEPPRHRDPGYRRSRSPAGNKKEPPASWLLMRDYLPYMMWASRIGLLTTGLFLIDYVLPYRIVEDGISEVFAVRIQGGSEYHIIVTDSGRKLALYDYRAANFRDELAVRVTLTRLYGTEMSVSNSSGTFVEKLAYMYRHLVFWPIILFVNSLLAILFRDRVELCFNLNLSVLILLAVNAALI